MALLQPDEFQLWRTEWKTRDRLIHYKQLLQNTLLKCISLRVISAFVPSLIFIALKSSDNWRENDCENR